MPDIIMCDRPATDKITGKYFEVYRDVVEAGENSVANVTQTMQYLNTLLASGKYILAAFRLNSESPAPATDEFGEGYIRYGVSGSTSASYTTRRYHNNAWATSTYGPNYTAVISPGSKFEVVSIKVKTWP